VYKAVTKEAALVALKDLENTWGNKYQIVIDSWNNNWNNLSIYFDFPQDIRRIIYTNNALEVFNRQLGKFTKVRTSFPTDDVLRKALYLATEQIMSKWTSPNQNWTGTLAQLV
jgi:transposase-like protein